jgi:hypothetical protein
MHKPACRKEPVKLPHDHLVEMKIHHHLCEIKVDQAINKVWSSNHFKNGQNRKAR